MPNDRLHSEVARLLDQMRNVTAVPNGMRKAIASAVDSLRDAAAPEEHLCVAGQFSATIHQWELALCLGAKDRQEAAMVRLEVIAKHWSTLTTLQPG